MDRTRRGVVAAEWAAARSLRTGRLRALHTAWMQDDCALRDEKLGVLEKLVRAGLRQVIIGVGRVDGAKGGAES